MAKIYIAVGVFIAVIGIVLVLTVIYGQPASESETKVKVIINNKEYIAEVAASAQQKAQGLSGRESLAVNRAMLSRSTGPGPIRSG